MQLPREMYMGGGISSLSYPSYGYADGGITTLPNYMGGGYIDEYGRQRYGLGKFVKKITKPVAKVLDKIVPNEIKPALPFIAAAVPFLAPALLPGLTAMQYAAISAGANAASQLSQEGAAERGLNPISVGLSALSGYGAAPGSGVGTSFQPSGLQEASTLRTFAAPSTELLSGIDDIGQLGYTASQTATGPLTFTDKLQNLGASALEGGARTLGEGTKSFESLIGPGEFTSKQALALGKAYVPGALQASGELAYNAALDAQKAYQNEMLAMGNLASANKQDQINYIRRAMVSAGFNENEISSAISRSGFMYGGKVESGLMSLKMGGMPAEMDLRKGGFVPLGVKEKADDVPARLSKNEFVFTAKAVRNAGGGDVRKGAKRMYQVMNQLEARA
jgi:hypothetical protein